MHIGCHNLVNLVSLDSVVPQHPKQKQEKKTTGKNKTIYDFMIVFFLRIILGLPEVKWEMCAI